LEYVASSLRVPVDRAENVRGSTFSDRRLSAEREKIRKDSIAFEKMRTYGAESTRVGPDQLKLSDHGWQKISRVVANCICGRILSNRRKSAFHEVAWETETEIRFWLVSVHFLLSSCMQVILPTQEMWHWPIQPLIFRTKTRNEIDLQSSALPLIV
jgi:hypothetical protein